MARGCYAPSVLGRLFLLFTLVPLVELYLLMTLGSFMGTLPTIALIAVTGMLGAALAKREGRKALTAYQQAAMQGQLPEDGIVSALLILVGGVLLITPGVLTDVFGLSMMIPPVRRATARLVKARLQRKLEEGVASGNVRVIGFGSGMGFGGGFGSGKGRGPSAGDDPAVGRGVVDVEVVDRKP